MIEDFLIQFSSLYLPMKYLAIISRHPVYIYIYIHRMSGNNRQIFHGQVERTKLNQKVLYHFVEINFLNKVKGILILKDNRIRASVRSTIAKCIRLPIA